MQTKIQQLHFSEFTRQEFLSRYWQKEPVIFKGGLPNFTDILTPEELAGLSLEDDVESRLIINKPRSNNPSIETQSDWFVQHGPFEEEDFVSLPETGWTLLVQSVEQWVPDALHLLASFSFIPDWRRDDLMISYATKNSGVGPHVDEYDVFLIQGLGSRVWRVGKPEQIVSLTTPTKDLRQIEPFHSQFEVVLQTGDILYIPPSTPHEGTALEPCLTYSIGFRAPEQSEIIEQVLLNKLASQTINKKRYQDTVPPSWTSPPLNRLPENLLSWSKESLECLSDKDWVTAFGQWVTRLKYPVEENMDIQSAREFLSQVDNWGKLQVNPISRFCFYENDDFVIFFADGEAIDAKKEWRDFYHSLNQSNPNLTFEIYFNPNDFEFIETIANLLNRGSIVVSDEFYD